MYFEMTKIQKSVTAYSLITNVGWSILFSIPKHRELVICSCNELGRIKTLLLWCLRLNTTWCIQGKVFHVVELVSVTKLSEILLLPSHDFLEKSSRLSLGRFLFCFQCLPADIDRCPCYFKTASWNTWAVFHCDVIPSSCSEVFCHLHFGKEWIETFLICPISNCFSI